MDLTDKEKITKNLTVLKERLEGDLDFFVDKLIEDGIFSLHTKEDIDSKDIPRQKVTAFINILVKSGPKAFKSFVKLLSFRGHHDIIDAMNQTEQPAAAGRIDRQFPAGPAPYQSSAVRARIAFLEQENFELISKKRKLNKQLKEKQNSLDNLMKETLKDKKIKAQQEKEIERLKKQIADLERKLRELEKEIKTTKEENELLGADKSAEIKQQQTDMNRKIDELGTDVKKIMTMMEHMYQKTDTKLNPIPDEANSSAACASGASAMTKKEGTTDVKSKLDQKQNPTGILPGSTASSYNKYVKGSKSEKKGK